MIIRERCIQSPFFFSVFFLLLSCTKVVIELEDAEGFQAYLQTREEAGSKIEYIEQESNRFLISFSGETEHMYSQERSSLFTIGLDGLWYKNGEKTVFEVENDSPETVIMNLSDGDEGLVAITEGYANWCFHFSRQKTYCFEKSHQEDYPERMMSINHRGFSKEAPENTLPAFRLSRLKGFSYAETDIQFTSDGVPVLLHDSDISRTSNGHGRIEEMTFLQARKYDYGNWKSPRFKSTQIPSLEEFLSLCTIIGLNPVLEIKAGTQEQIQQIVKLVSDYQLNEESWYISFSFSSLMSVLSADPTANVCFLCDEVSEKNIEYARKLDNGQNRVVVNSSDFSDSAVDKCKGAGLPLWAWVIDSEERIKSLSPYVSGVTSNNIHAGRILYGSSRCEL